MQSEHSVLPTGGFERTAGTVSISSGTIRTMVVMMKFLMMMMMVMMIKKETIED